jgi:hypothetical protein
MTIASRNFETLYNLNITAKGRHGGGREPKFILQKLFPPRTRIEILQCAARRVEMTVFKAESWDIVANAWLLRFYSPNRFALSPALQDAFAIKLTL